MKNFLIVVAVAATGSVILVAQTARPGDMTQARVWVENRGQGEAVPVAIESMSPDSRPLRAEVIGTTEVALAPGAVALTRSARQQWEHRVVAIAAGQDASAALSTAGNDGWEAVGFQITAQGSTTVLLKRPR